MTESIVLNQTQTDGCKEIVTDGIYTVCADTGEVLQYDEERFFTNTEGIDKKSKSDRVYSHYQRHYDLLPNQGIGTIPAGFDRNLSYFAFAHRLSTFITNSAQKAFFTQIAQKILHRKIKHKLYILGAFAIRYCNVDFNRVVQLMLNFTGEEEDTVRQKLSDVIAKLTYILNKKVYLSEAPRAGIQMRKQFLQQFKYDLLSRYGYINKIDKFSKLYNPGIIKIAVILLLLRDKRRNEAIQLYNSYPEYNTSFNHFIVEYEVGKNRYVRRLTHKYLRTLLFLRSARLYNFKIIL
ncbi:hypothetical protein [Sulfolobus monocaudavirus SMV4]|uniref:hypothetical protein n=1 Tax=Sulfolobus monocaudavirus SMV4 TaxID=1732178 RepID=UPI0007068FBC|nr:hypothetical protein AVT99_gp54 [Sulfolobus monocaudavirus SMV4]ALG97078.1 hypothetical protein [Sulfolobus monocaudavirus SMV4]